jgi:hypothetical protein
VVVSCRQVCDCETITQPSSHLELEDAALVLSTHLMCPKHLEQGCAVAVPQPRQLLVGPQPQRLNMRLNSLPIRSTAHNSMGQDSTTQHLPPFLHDGPMMPQLMTPAASYAECSTAHCMMHRPPCGLMVQRRAVHMLCAGSHPCYLN